MSVHIRFGAAIRAVVTAAAITAVPGLAHADWRKAETQHFVVYSNGFERELRDYAVQLERIDQLIRSWFGLPAAENERKLPVYLVRNRDELEMAQPGLPESSGGVYAANFRDIRAIVIRTVGDEVLRHEYGHHFMYRNFPGNYPAWFREGFADFVMTATVAPDGQATLGMISPMRFRTLQSGRWLPMEQVLSGRIDPQSREQRAAFYAQSWLLMHWILTDPGRRSRMDAYLGDTARGVPPEAALTARFGMDPTALGRALRAYRDTNPRYAELDIGAASPAVTISRLPPSADDVLLMDVNARDGGAPDEGPEILAKAREAAARWPGDALAQTMLARVELAWGDPAAAERAVQPLLEADPANVDLLLLIAEARLTAGDKLGNPEERDRLYGQARGYLARAYAADPGDHRVYQTIAHSRRFAPDYPTENDVELWRRAVAIAPQVATNRPVAAEAMLRHGLVDEAEQVIQPIANDPHGGETSPRVQRILTRIAAARAEGGSPASAQ